MANYSNRSEMFDVSNQRNEQFSNLWFHGAPIHEDPPMNAGRTARGRPEHLPQFNESAKSFIHERSNPALRPSLTDREARSSYYPSSESATDLPSRPSKSRPNFPPGEQSLHAPKGVVDSFRFSDSRRPNAYGREIPTSATRDLQSGAEKYPAQTLAYSQQSPYANSMPKASRDALPNEQHFPESSESDQQYLTNNYASAVPSRNPFNDSSKPSLHSFSSDSAENEINAVSAYETEKRAGLGRGKYPFKSYRLKSKFEQPWKDDPRIHKTNANNWIVRAFMLVGVLLSAFVCFRATQSVSHHPYCLIFEDDFKQLDSSVWTHEVQIDGFGNQAFDWTTTDPKNSYVDSEGLHIVPTLTNETTNFNNDLLYNGGTLNLTKDGGDGSCTSSDLSACAIKSNSTLGRMIPPVRSARLSTKGKKSIRYGKVEVVAKMPKGDWLWPAIWMFPEDSVYGIWPRSGEIDIAEGRGNDENYAPGGRDIFTSTLHWGPTAATDTFWKTTNGHLLRRTDFTKEFHTFGVEWSEDYIYTYLDSHIIQVLFVGFKKNKGGLWGLGGFGTMQENSTLLTNPWQNSKDLGAPFDQDFYLILNVAVGGKNGWFPDNKGNKPWLNAGASAQWDFYSDSSNWLPTWGAGDERGMTVKSVKMWQQGACR